MEPDGGIGAGNNHTADISQREVAVRTGNGLLVVPRPV